MSYQGNCLVVSVKLNFVGDRLTASMIEIKFNLLQILAMNSLIVKHQRKSSNQLAFHLSAYTDLWKRDRVIFHEQYRMYCSEYFNIFEYLVLTSYEIKKRSWNNSKTWFWKRKSYHHRSTSSCNKCLWRWQFQ